MTQNTTKNDKQKQCDTKHNVLKFIWPEKIYSRSHSSQPFGRLILDYLAGKQVSEQEFCRPHQNHVTSINSEINHRVNGNVLIAKELSDAL